MSSTGIGNGEAFDATVQTTDHDEPRTADQQAYLDAIADAAERAVEHVQDMIENLQASLTERRAEAERARAEASGNEGPDA